MMSDSAHDRIGAMVNGSEVLLFMKGTAMFPQCGFSSRAIAILQHLGVLGLADDPPALCEGRVRRRFGHHDGNV